MSTNTQTSTPIRATEHAKLRWQQRVGGTDVYPTEAWREGYGVGVPDHHGKARLHPPIKTVLLERDNQLVTVLNASYLEFRADHLLRCTDCHLQFQPTNGDRDCPWCTTCDEVESP